MIIFVALFLFLTATWARHHGEASVEAFAEDWNNGFMSIPYVLISISCLLAVAFVINLTRTKLQKLGRDMK